MEGVTMLHVGDFHFDPLRGSARFRRLLRELSG
jgi:hypothetical protein